MHAAVHENTYSGTFLNKKKNWIMETAGIDKLRLVKLNLTFEFRLANLDWPNLKITVACKWRLGKNELTPWGARQAIAFV